MPLFESESLVLRSYDLAEADRIVVFFTRSHGIVRGVAKGAKRLKSRFGSSLEPFSTVNLQYFQKDDRELVSVQAIELTGSRFAAASDPEFLATFAYLADLLAAMLPPHDPNETTYRMAKACIATDWKGADELAAVRLYFEAWLLRLGGFLPDWSNCAECGRGVLPQAAAFLFNEVHLLCGACRGTRRLAIISSIHRELLRNIQRFAPAEFVKQANSESSAVAELSSILRRIVAGIVGWELLNGRTLTVNS